MGMSLEDYVVEVELLKQELRKTYRFIDSHIHYSQPNHESGMEPSDVYSYEAPMVLSSIQELLGEDHDKIILSEPISP